MRLFKFGCELTLTSINKGSLSIYKFVALESIHQIGKMSRSLIKYGQLPEKRTAFFLCDIQEKFRPALSHFEQILEAAKKLV